MRTYTPDRLATNGITLEAVVAGDGPLVVLLHGFPECWYSWRHQIDALVAAGYRVAVPNQRGYGASDCPQPVADYDILALTADVAGMADALGAERYTVVGHDWGALVAWHCALLQPARVERVVAASVPYVRFQPGVLTDQRHFGDRMWYIAWFQQPDVAEAELGHDVRRTLRRVFWALAGEAPDGLWLGQVRHPAADGLLACLAEPPSLPAWLTEDDLDHYVRQFERSGFRGPINWYRNFDRNLALTPQLERARVRQPALFIAGDRDPVLGYRPGFVDAMREWVEDLRAVVLLPGAGHWIAAERPGAVTESLLEFLRSTDQR
ncbi:MAG: alpha/beta hydrolase [Gammaproteobacteria bacterium]|nr:alpha/beta hydrolase [Gammaproteobacteria bacterium]